MHEKERHRFIVEATRAGPVVTVQSLVGRLGASEATIRRDISKLCSDGKINRVHGGVEAMNADAVLPLETGLFNESVIENVAEKKAIAREAARLCDDGDSIIINGGSTTSYMAHYLRHSNLRVLSNSFPIAEFLIKETTNTVIIVGGVVYRDQGLILSPFESDVIRNFSARRMFIGAKGVGPLGVMESDPLIIQEERRLMERAEDTILCVDSSKFLKRSSMVQCALEQINTVITDEKVSDQAARLVEEAGVRLITVVIHEDH
ncbi:DeoR/GlpR family DNA-binding transcription regulator [Pseudovibrio sp. Tun.PSC04-5.I4]|uniref:DeoR/GlpR family DNA-binding transcription regulator n=1 Tax=Pseudovibrio sp. Tun.PSC04-5.I4 TaxID=1798213 RepID=UPI00087F248F|nr:DeoR/GlpR family DNA-binding transcription regulator [Pseudovibrio sp. Tun.PSC04-5.I4]SDQ13148.1 transcriptional regulator, DeoR family [Pseudovibrio sp. Tun.PSC04-5.I4]